MIDSIVRSGCCIWLRIKVGIKLVRSNKNSKLISSLGWMLTFERIECMFFQGMINLIKEENKDI